MPAQMAYVFMTDGEDYVAGTWEPDGGENAVILQPGNPPGNVRALSQGPSRYCMVQREVSKGVGTKPCEFAVQYTLDEDPVFAPESEPSKWSKDGSAGGVNVIFTPPRSVTPTI